MQVLVTFDIKNLSLFKKTYFIIIVNRFEY